MGKKATAVICARVPVGMMYKIRVSTGTKQLMIGSSTLQERRMSKGKTYFRGDIESALP